jgi:2-oxo-4-hydroxy-4-carboxy-5-ureidoimidazoline decarboxylase
MTLRELNGKDCRGFVEAVGWVFESSPWVAERAWTKRPFLSFDALHEEMARVVASAAPGEQLALLRAHPDLGERAAMSDASTREQAKAGLDTLAPEDLARLLALNTAYREKFGFPFLYAVKGAGTRDVLDAIERRLSSARDAERQEALRQVFRIARFRLEEVVNQP